MDLSDERFCNKICERINKRINQITNKKYFMEAVNYHFGQKILNKIFILIKQECKPTIHQ